VGGKHTVLEAGVQRKGPSRNHGLYHRLTCRENIRYYGRSGYLETSWRTGSTPVELLDMKILSTAVQRLLLWPRRQWYCRSWSTSLKTCCRRAYERPDVISAAMRAFIRRLR
jgi:hypothetical protein